MADEDYQGGWRLGEGLFPRQRPEPLLKSWWGAAMGELDQDHPSWLPKPGSDSSVWSGEAKSPSASQPNAGFFTGPRPYAPDSNGPIRNGLNGNGYVPQPGDDNPLARLIMAEGASTPQDMEALGWAVVNRIGMRGHGRSLDQVTNQKNAFQSVQGKKDSLWQQSANPEGFTGDNASAWKRSQATAQGILSGTIPDPTGGATLFFSSKRYDPEDLNTAPRGWFPKAIGRGDLVPSSSYPSTPDRTSGNRNYFFVENPYRK